MLFISDSEFRFKDADACLIFKFGERMKHRNMRYAPLLAQEFTYQAGQPVVTVYEVIAQFEIFAERQYGRSQIRNMIIEVNFRNGAIICGA